MKACVIIPTYNEAENIKRIVEKLQRHPVDVAVVDDNSPDGTADIAESCGARVIRREKKEGLGKAYVHAFKILADEYDVLFEMDADLSHDPQHIRRFLKEIEEADFIIGSRYVKRGRIKNWNVLRRIISKTGNLLGRNISGINANDCTSGYRAIRTSLLKRIDLDSLRGGGYAFQISLLKAAQNTGARIKEIPITFVERRAGKSKLSKKDIIEFLLVCFKLRIRQ